MAVAGFLLLTLFAIGTSQGGRGSSDADGTWIVSGRESRYDGGLSRRLQVTSSQPPTTVTSLSPTISPSGAFSTPAGSNSGTLSVSSSLGPAPTSASLTATASFSFTASFSKTVSFTKSPKSISTTPSYTTSPSSTRTSTATPSSTKSVSFSATVTKTTTKSPSMTRTVSRTSSVTRTASKSPTWTPTTSKSKSNSATASTTPSYLTSLTATPSGSMTDSVASSVTLLLTPTPSVSPTTTPTQTMTATGSDSVSSSCSPSYGSSISRSRTPTSTHSSTKSVSWSRSGSRTISESHTETPSVSETPSATGSASCTSSFSASDSITPSGSSSDTPSDSWSGSDSLTPSASGSVSITPSVSPSPVCPEGMFTALSAGNECVVAHWVELVVEVRDNELNQSSLAFLADAESFISTSAATCAGNISDSVVRVLGNSVIGVFASIHLEIGPMTNVEVLAFTTNLDDCLVLLEGPRRDLTVLTTSVLGVTSGCSPACQTCGALDNPQGCTSCWAGFSLQLAESSGSGNSHGVNQAGSCVTVGTDSTSSSSASSSFGSTMVAVVAACVTTLFGLVIVLAYFVIRSRQRTLRTSQTSSSGRAGRGFQTAINVKLLSVSECAALKEDRDPEQHGLHGRLDAEVTQATQAGSSASPPLTVNVNAWTAAARLTSTTVQCVSSSDSETESGVVRELTPSVFFTSGVKDSAHHSGASDLGSAVGHRQTRLPMNSARQLNLAGAGSHRDVPRSSSHLSDGQLEGASEYPTVWTAPITLPTTLHVKPSRKQRRQSKLKSRHGRHGYFRAAPGQGGSRSLGIGSGFGKSLIGTDSTRTTTEEPFGTCTTELPKAQLAVDEDGAAWSTLGAPNQLEASLLEAETVDSKLSSPKYRRHRRSHRTIARLSALQGVAGPPAAARLGGEGYSSHTFASRHGRKLRNQTESYSAIEVVMPLEDFLL